MPRSINLDVLRAFAVMLVFVNHIACMVRGNSIIDDGAARFGVILFFVHTSCVLMGSMQSLRTEGDSWVSRFFLRRVFRLYPLALVLIAISVLGRAPEGPWMGLNHVPYSIPVLLPNVLLIQNVVAKPAVIGVMWSLAIEVEMYLVLPLVFLLVRSKNWGRKVTFLWLGSAAVIVAVQTVARAALRGGHNFSALDFVPCFLAGAIAYRLAGPARRWPSYLWLPSLLALIAVGRHWAFFAPVFWGCCLTLAFLYSRIAELPWNPFTRICHWVAKYSYGIYLTHPFGLWISYQLLGAHLHSPLIRLAATIAFTIVASVTSFHLIEDPMIRFGKRWTSRARTVWQTAPRTVGASLSYSVSKGPAGPAIDTNADCGVGV